MERPRKSGAAAPMTTLIRTPKNDKLVVAILSRTLAKFSTHWCTTREELCLTSIGRTCPACEEGTKRRSSYYVVATRGIGEEPVVVHIPEGAVENCPALLARANNCRGLVVTLTRMGNRQTVKAMVRDTPCNPAALTDDGSWLFAYLMRLWRVSDGQAAAASFPADATDTAFDIDMPLSPVLGHDVQPADAAHLDAATVEEIRGSYTFTLRAREKLSDTVARAHSETIVARIQKPPTETPHPREIVQPERSCEADFAAATPESIERLDSQLAGLPGIARLVDVLREREELARRRAALTHPSSNGVHCNGKL